MPMRLPAVRIIGGGKRTVVEVDGMSLPATAYRVEREAGGPNKFTVTFWADVRMTPKPEPLLLDQMLAACVGGG